MTTPMTRYAMDRKDDQKQYDYSFQQYQDRNYDFIAKRIGADDDRSKERAYASGAQ